MLFLMVVVVFDYHFLLSLAYPLYGVSVVLLLGCWSSVGPFPGLNAGSTLASFSFQPSELVKISLVLALAKYFFRNENPSTYGFRDLYIPFGPGSVSGSVDYEAAGPGDGAVIVAGDVFHLSLPGR